MIKRLLVRPRFGLARALVVACTVAGVLGGATAASAAGGASIVVDAKTGKVLFAENPDTRRFPASLTKMMTLYLLFERLDAGKTSLTARIPISSHAAAQAPSKLGLKPGTSISVRDAIYAIVTRSANDIAVAIGEYVGGSEDAFAVKMTAKARELGMSSTIFRNASGLPDPGQVTTARDMATLGRALQDRFPGYFKFFSATSFTFNGHRIPGHNRLLGKVAGVNGIKTGYTRAAGYNLVTSVDRGNRKLVAVVLGGNTGRERDQKMTRLVEAYLPRASAGPRTAPLIAKAAPSLARQELAEMAAVPAPRIKPDFSEAEPDGATLSVASVDVAPDRVTDEGDGGDDAAIEPPAKPAKVMAAKVKVDRSEQTASIAPKAVDGWKIQIAAAPSQSSAQDQLKKARAAAPKILASADDYLEPVSKDGATLYRARFSGFKSKDAARAACSYLARKNVSCLALQ
ncbi:MAG: D-alanyl-D-alanine carboxypeptidase [Rhizobiales bacterium]|nr:D-alanyl-D-alanine carboxypeptidase [Hyphomicrobiales bacterium]